MKAPRHKTPIVWCDNSGAIAVALNPVYHGRTKHIEIDVHYIRDKVKDETLEVRYVPTQDQMADIMTKPLTGQNFKQLVGKLNIT